MRVPLLVILVILALISSSADAQRVRHGGTNAPHHSTSIYGWVLNIPLQGHVYDVVPTGNTTTDTANAQSAINTAQTGDTVRFDSGNFSLSQITLKTGILYKGQTGAVLNGAGTNPMVAFNPNDSQNIILDHLTFNNGRVALVGNSAAGSVNNITVANCTFENWLTQGDMPLYFDWLKNSLIANNTFSNINGGGSIGAVGGYHLQKTPIVYNQFLTVYQAVKIIFDGTANTGQGIIISDNIGNGINRMGIETWDVFPGPAGDTQQLTIENNWFANWIPATLDSPNNTVAYSIANDGGTGTLVDHNYANAGSQLTGNIAIELSGTAANANTNYVKGFNTAIISYESFQVIENNNLVATFGTGNGAVNVFTSQSSGDTIQGNYTDASAPVPPQPTLGP